MRSRKIAFCVLIVLATVSVLAAAAYAAPGVSVGPDGIKIGSVDNKDVSTTIQALLILTVLSLAPSILIMMTSFTRIIIILSFLRNALGTQQMPPNQVLIGLALFLTLFIMSPIAVKLNDEAYKPLSNGQITTNQGYTRAAKIMKTFMLNQLHRNNEKDLALFVKLAKVKTPVKPENLPLRVVIPAFMINELTVAFEMGFLIFIPFLIIDLVVSSTLMSMGMMMLPPSMISLPFKILLFVMVDGWGLMVKSIVTSFAT